MGRGPSIEGRKNAVDAKRGKIFTKVIREISVAARAGGGDPSGNPRLRAAIDKGLAVNMSKDVIERAVRKATGELEGVEYEEIRYEGYAPGGVAVIVDCLTDNRVRTVADVRHAFGKFGGNMGTEGSVAFMFQQARRAQLRQRCRRGRDHRGRDRGRCRRRVGVRRRRHRRGHRAGGIRRSEGGDGSRRPAPPVSPK